MKQASRLLANRILLCDIKDHHSVKEEGGEELGVKILVRGENRFTSRQCKGEESNQKNR